MTVCLFPLTDLYGKNWKLTAEIEIVKYWYSNQEITACMTNTVLILLIKKRVKPQLGFIVWMLVRNIPKQNTEFSYV
jgi:hypothetical protein